jgi:MOSC domain-containing protein YiiM
MKFAPDYSRATYDPQLRDTSASTVQPIAVDVLTGQLRTIGGTSTKSGIFKLPITTPVFVDWNGLSGDVQADLRFHGGRDKAIHHYPFENYEFWSKIYPDSEFDRARPGYVGENISTIGYTESEVCIGDIFELGEAIVQISEGRTPCRKLDMRFEIGGLGRKIRNTGKIGWYYRVLRRGSLKSGDILRLTERPFPNWTVERVHNLIFKNNFNENDLNSIINIDTLGRSWKSKAVKKINNRKK